MEIVSMRLEDIIPYENNPRMNDEAVGMVVKSIQEFGFKNPIIIDKNNVIICGHTRYRAARELGLKQVPCIVAKDLTPAQVKAFRLADNKVSDYSIWDNQKLLKELEEIDKKYFTGFTESDFFDDVENMNDVSPLDEGDNDVVSNNIGGVQYRLVLHTGDKELIEDVKKYIEEREVIG